MSYSITTMPVTTTIAFKHDAEYEQYHNCIKEMLREEGECFGDDSLDSWLLFHRMNYLMTRKLRDMPVNV